MKITSVFNLLSISIFDLTIISKLPHIKGIFNEIIILLGKF
jgi:hypothetical protein